jgi:hypothetical protein
VDVVCANAGIEAKENRLNGDNEGPDWPVIDANDPASKELYRVCSLNQINQSNQSRVNRFRPAKFGSFFPDLLRSAL